ncbi:hypothetical protein GCM10010381_10020 [Streptomyces xantholiticus]|nr:hypothetical protein GCM10010381_10020 [Streptomyces xantholiticus]
MEQAHRVWAVRRRVMGECPPRDARSPAVAGRRLAAPGRRDRAHEEWTAVREAAAAEWGADHALVRATAEALDRTGRRRLECLQAGIGCRSQMAARLSAEICAVRQCLDAERQLPGRFTLEARVNDADGGSGATMSDQLHVRMVTSERRLEGDPRHL